MKFRPTMEKLESRELQAPFFGQTVYVPIPPIGVQYPVVVKPFPSYSVPVTGSASK